LPVPEQSHLCVCIAYISNKIHGEFYFKYIPKLNKRLSIPKKKRPLTIEFQQRMLKFLSQYVLNCFLYMDKKEHTFCPVSGILTGINLQILTYVEKLF